MTTSDCVPSASQGAILRSSEEDPPRTQQQGVQASLHRIEKALRSAEKRERLQRRQRKSAQAQLLCVLEEEVPEIEGSLIPAPLPTPSTSQSFIFHSQLPPLKESPQRLFMTPASVAYKHWAQVRVAKQHIAGVWQTLVVPWFHAEVKGFFKTIGERLEAMERRLADMRTQLHDTCWASPLHTAAVSNNKDVETEEEGGRGRGEVNERCTADESHVGRYAGNSLSSLLRPCGSICCSSFFSSSTLAGSVRLIPRVLAEYVSAAKAEARRNPFYVLAEYLSDLTDAEAAADEEDEEEQESSGAVGSASRWRPLSPRCVLGFMQDDSEHDFTKSTHGEEHDVALVASIGYYLLRASQAYGLHLCSLSTSLVALEESGEKVGGDKWVDVASLYVQCAIATVAMYYAELRAFHACLCEVVAAALPAGASTTITRREACDVVSYIVNMTSTVIPTLAPCGTAQLLSSLRYVQRDGTTEECHKEEDDDECHRCITEEDKDMTSALDHCRFTLHDAILFGLRRQEQQEQQGVRQLCARGLQLQRQMQSDDTRWQEAVANVRSFLSSPKEEECHYHCAAAERVRKQSECDEERFRIGNAGVEDEGRLCACQQWLRSALLHESGGSAASDSTSICPLPSSSLDPLPSSQLADLRSLCPLLVCIENECAGGGIAFIKEA